MTYFTLLLKLTFIFYLRVLKEVGYVLRIDRFAQFEELSAVPHYNNSINRIQWYKFTIPLIPQM